MRARLIEQPATLFERPDPSSLPVAMVNVGEEMDLGGVKKGGGKKWVKAKLPNGQSGYLPGESKVFRIKRATLQQEDVPVYAQPGDSASPQTRLSKKTTVWMTDNVKQDGQSWVKIRDASGTEGFIPGATRIKVIAEVTRSLGMKRMLYGALWCIGGTAVTVYTYARAQGGGTYLVAYGAIIFGALQFLRGAFQMVTARA